MRGFFYCATILYVSAHGMSYQFRKISGPEWTSSTFPHYSPAKKRARRYSTTLVCLFWETSIIHGSHFPPRNGPRPPPPYRGYAPPRSRLREHWLQFRHDRQRRAIREVREHTLQETGHEPIQVALRTKQITVNSSEVVQTYLDKRCHTFSATVLSLGLVFFV